MNKLRRWAAVSVLLTVSALAALPTYCQEARTPDVIFVPTEQAVVDEMLRMAKVSKNSVVYDLGCGDGRIVITAARHYGARGVGIDIDPERIRNMHYGGGAGAHRNPPPAFHSTQTCVSRCCLCAAGVDRRWILVYYNYQSRRALTEQRMLETARALTLVVDRELASIQASLSVLATSTSLVSGDLPAFYHRVQVVLEAYPDAHINLADATGQELLNTALPFGAPLPQRNTQDARKLFATGRPLVTSVFRGAVTGKLAISVDVPVFRDGRVVYDLAMIVFPDRFGTVLSQQHLPPEWVGSILDSNQVVVTRTRLAEKFVGRQAGPVARQSRPCRGLRDDA
jgi:SAM-dependent methyltransferase